MKHIIKYFPFVAIIALNVLAEASGFRMRNVQPFVLIITSIIAINFIIALVLKINLILNYFWAGLFALGMVLTVIPYHSDSAINTIIATLVPIVLQLAIGIPVTAKLPDYLMQKVGGEQIIFQSVKDLFASMPFGLNKENAKSINTVVQFFLTGKEPTIGHLIISEQKCTYTEGEHSRKSNLNTKLLHQTK